MNAKKQEYAKLLVEVGVNVRKGQILVINCAVDHAPFARLCADAAYARGVREVVMVWNDDYLTRQKYLHAEDSVFTDYPQWCADMLYHYAKEGACFLFLVSDDPENLLGVDSERILAANKSAGEALKPYRELRDKNTCPWSIGALASPAWAKKVFPQLSETEAVEALWEKILMAVHVKGDGTAVEAWRAHAKQLKEHMRKLNEFHFRTLHYKNALGTDLVVELAKDHVWEAGGDTTVFGQDYMPNMPTEECFTACNKTGVNGVIHASMPLVKDGNVIENIRFVLKDGKIVDATASSGEDILRAAISVDEGASYLGEVALVPYDSPIQNSKTLYYETLFDENASCHFAFGKAYNTNVKGGLDMTKEELIAAGLNDSVTHVDFMVGTADLSIVGTTWDGQKIPVFENGNFAF